ncbi:type VII secretion-associated serine protease mycosin [Amycolatopsis jiangsuensis]|uniref:Type VII secretion-associated serine protease mycosin n=1 Tax=Amycolatopsis jiangsuensis TaxID=1181879 RepID=A0A840J2U8_9PSEU|nr:type VII secretion-associated serine protease mycosin [Amycolatopsis jiangsuensis]MBB4688380.1 type VII secretion-associated serine protease mycosin [Amycolatopsis jiangsuensis]
MKRFVALLALVPALLASVPPLADAAPPAGACTSAESAHSVIVPEPWAQQLFDPKRVWPRSTGSGVLVAVVDSGVDSDHPQLRAPGKVLPGRDFFYAGALPGNYDCVSHGTAVASIIAADPVAGVGFAGIAPGARILPVRITDRALNDGGEPQPIDPEAVGKGIRYAADQGAKVINLSLSGYRDLPAIRDAVRYAQSRDALIVAAAGNRQQDFAGSASFPAGYPGVLGVGSIDIAGARDDSSQIGGYVDVMAPGKSVVAATRAGGHDYWEGTSFATPFVAGTAALVRSAWPSLDAQQVAQRLTATAAVARGGAGSPAYGAGILDPYRAVTEGLSGAPAVLPAVAPQAVDVAAEREHAWWARTGSTAKLVAAALVLAILLAVLGTAVATRGRRRRWRAGRSAATPRTVAREEPPEEMFLFPPPAVERPQS